MKEKKDVEQLLTYTCLGFSILEETKDTLVIKDIAEIHESEFENVFRKIFFLTNQIAKNTLECAKTGEISFLIELLSQRKTLHKYTDFCRRIINKHIEIIPSYPTYVFYLIMSIECITQHYRNLCFVLVNKEYNYFTYPDDIDITNSKQKIKLNQKHLVLMEKINFQVYSLATLFYNHSLEEIDNSHHQCLSLIKEMEDEIRKNNNKEYSLILSYWFQIIFNMKELRGTFLGLCLS